MNLNRRLRKVQIALKINSKEKLKKCAKTYLDQFEIENSAISGILKENTLEKATYYERRKMYIECAKIEIQNAKEYEQVERLTILEDGAKGKIDILRNVLITILATVLSVMFRDSIISLGMDEDILTNLMILTFTFVFGIGITCFLLYLSDQTDFILKTIKINDDYFRTNDVEIKLIKDNLWLSEKDILCENKLSRLDVLKLRNKKR